MVQPLESPELEALQVRWRLAQQEERGGPASNLKACGILLGALVAASVVFLGIWAIFKSALNESVAYRDSPIDGTMSKSARCWLSTPPSSTMSTVPIVWKQFNEDVRFADPPSNASDKAWSQLLPCTCLDPSPARYPIIDH
jgi:hypothetical protein